MSYIINKTNGQQLTSVVDGTTDTTASSLTLVGQNYIGWGEIFQENLIHIMENFARGALPPNALQGQLWFDSNEKILKVLVAEDTWRPLSTSTSSITAPNSPNVGDLWYDSRHKQLKIWDSAHWQVVGPVYTSQQGPTGANAVTMSDFLTSPRNVVTLEAQGGTFAIFNPTYEFTPFAEVAGFGPLIKRGFNFRSNIVDEVLFHGTVDNTMKIQGLYPNVFVRNDQDGTIFGNLSLRSNQGLWLGENSALKVYYDAIESDVEYGNVIVETSNEHNLRIVGSFNDGGKTILQSNVRSGLMTVFDDPVSDLGISTKQYTDNSVSIAVNLSNSYLKSNVAAINNTIGILTTEVNRVNNYSLNLMAIKANVESPGLTGIPTAPNASPGTNTTQLASTAFVNKAISDALDRTDFVPPGMVAMWSGTVTNIPTGWALCNGQNNTPDLRNRFIVGAGTGSDYAVGAAGGSKDATLVNHSHNLSLTDSGHTHNYWDAYGAYDDDYGHTFTDIDGRHPLYFPWWWPGTWGHPGDEGEGGNGHSVQDVQLHRATELGRANMSGTAAATGSPATNANLPPYYALCYIMKLPR